MPGPVSDSYDPEFGTGSNAQDVLDGIKEARDIIGETLGEKLSPIVGVAQGPDGECVEIKLSERHRRLIRFALNRALETI